MKTITIPETKIELFPPNELDSEAMEKALQWYNGVNHWWNDENQESLQAFCDFFTIKWEGYQYDLPQATAIYPDVAQLDLHHILSVEEGGEHFKGVRLWKYFQANDTLPDLSGECPFTGYCMDEVLLDPLRAFMARPDTSLEYPELLRQCLESWVHACARDYEYQQSEESFIESAQANEWYFTQDGEFYNE